VVFKLSKLKLFRADLRSGACQGLLGKTGTCGASEVVLEVEEAEELETDIALETYLLHGLDLASADLDYLVGSALGAAVVLVAIGTGLALQSHTVEAGLTPRRSLVVDQVLADHTAEVLPELVFSRPVVRVLLRKQLESVLCVY